MNFSPTSDIKPEISSFEKNLVVMYYTPGHLCPGCVVHHYSYQSAQFDGKLYFGTI